MLLIIGITGASGAIYGIRLLEILKQLDKVETHLIITKSGENVIKCETTYEVSEVKKLANFWYDIDDIGACLSSGSFLTDGMVVTPCSMRTMSAIANSYADNLLVRAADVTLKERRTLILLARETPLHQGHLRNMLHLAEMNAIILPPVPSFYHMPKNIDDIVVHTVAKVLDLLAIKHTLSQRWGEVQRYTR
ncbi:UbiX family flavin prenyltransferase [Chloroflexota bacterium]